MKASTLWFFLVYVLLMSCETKEIADENHNFDVDESIVNEMEAELSQLNEEIVSLKDNFEFFLASRDSLLARSPKSKYQFDQGYSVNTPQDSGKLSSVVILNTSPDYDKAMENILISNGMDSLFDQTLQKHGMLAQVYYNTLDQVSRVYPAYDAKALLDPELDLSKFNFFYEGDFKHNPSKGPKWISEVYVDPAGRGWILSLVHPVLDKGELYAVLGIDITVEEIIGRYIDSKKGDFLIVTSKGDIVGGNAAAIEALSFPPLLNHVYRETIRADNFRVSDFNLFNSKNREVRKMAQAIILKKERYFDFENAFSPKFAYAIPFTLLDWYLIEIVTKS